MHPSNEAPLQLEKLSQSGAHQPPTTPTEPDKSRNFRQTDFRSSTKNGLYRDHSEEQSEESYETQNSGRNSRFDLHPFGMYTSTGHQNRQLTEVHKTPKKSEWLKRPLEDGQDYPRALRKRKLDKYVDRLEPPGCFQEESSGHDLSSREGHDFSKPHTEAEYGGDSTDTFLPDSISVYTTYSSSNHIGHYVPQASMSLVEASYPGFPQLRAVLASNVHQDFLVLLSASSQGAESHKCYSQNHKTTRNTIEHQLLGETSAVNGDVESPPALNDAENPEPTANFGDEEGGARHGVQARNAMADEESETSVNCNGSKFASDRPLIPDNEGSDRTQKDGNWGDTGTSVGFGRSTASDPGGDDPADEKFPRKSESFHRFSQLPKELRVKIWRFAMPEGRRVKIGIQFQKNRRSLPRTRNLLKRRVPLTNLLTVNKESREEVLRYLVVLFQDAVWPNKRRRPAQIPWKQVVHSLTVARQLCQDPQPIAFDASRDLLWLPSQFLLKSGSRAACELLYAMNENCPRTLEKIKMLTIDCRWLEEGCPKMDCLKADDRRIDWCLESFPNLDFLYAIINTIRHDKYRVDIQTIFREYLGAIKQHAERKNKAFKIPQALIFTKEETQCVHNRISAYHTWMQYKSEFHEGVKKCTAGTWILARKHTNEIYLPELGFYRNPGCQDLPERLNAQSAGCCGKRSLEKMENWDEFGSIVDGVGKLIHFKYTDSLW
ncbi:hypothetical protein DL95DRAFT_406576 [Leptodontidium sp. 2 PMI_412]|nr:hypothetical protein DL95DRAFT_406576 [Leptodontidium sp. 2 PMI_412]